MLSMEPILVLITIYLSVVYGVLYACEFPDICFPLAINLSSSPVFEAFPVIFVETHGFTLSQNGLIFIGVGIGTTLGAMLNFYFSTKVSAVSDKWRGFPPAEMRLYGAMTGGPILVIGSFWLGWTGNYPSVHWAAPAVATIVLGVSISLIFMSCLSYLVDTYL